MENALPSANPLWGGQATKDDANGHLAGAFFIPFERLPIPVHSMGPDGLLLHVNEAWTAYTGYSRSRAIGCSFADFLDPPSARRYLGEAVPEIIATVPAGESRSVEYRLIKASGDIADIVLAARPERDAATGQFLHSLAVINDITDRNRAEATLRQTQKLEALGGLTGGVAHDFNNLLAVILGSLELLGHRLPATDKRAARLLDAATKGAERGATLTKRLLAFGRQQELTPRPIDTAHLYEVLKPLLIRLLGPEIQIETDFPADLWTLRADADQLELALLNLAANARDAMPAGGRLRLSAHNATVGLGGSAFIAPVPRPMVPAGDHVVLAVSDTGVGMDDLALARAADPFFTTKGPGKGTGLGLSMVHGFAIQSGGAMLLSSRPGAGTRVELWLPRTTESLAEASNHGVSVMPRTAGTVAPNRRVLVVDDDALVLASATAQLEELGFEAIYTATSGEAALNLLRREARFDLLLTDYMMPGMTGVELAGRARALDPELPIVVASGFADAVGPIGADWLRLGKPYGLKELSAALIAIGLIGGSALERR